MHAIYDPCSHATNGIGGSTHGDDLRWTGCAPLVLRYIRTLLMIVVMCARMQGSVNTPTSTEGGSFVEHEGDHDGVGVDVASISSSKGEWCVVGDGASAKSGSTAAAAAPPTKQQSPVKESSALSSQQAADNKGAAPSTAAVAAGTAVATVATAVSPAAAATAAPAAASPAADAEDAAGGEEEDGGSGSELAKEDEGWGDWD